MGKQSLKQSIDNIHNLLQNEKSIDTESLASLQKLMEDIHKILENSELNNEEIHKSLIDDLSSMARKFEATHPKVSESINILINGLSNFGL
ncbi:MAG TPA: DUF4404 family protein [Ignavibacteriaceae bacterium]|nr:DUF4404 family protein [Ignavibacteriaceae bacterium]